MVYGRKFSCLDVREYATICHVIQSPKTDHATGSTLYGVQCNGEKTSIDFSKNKIYLYRDSVCRKLNQSDNRLCLPSAMMFLRKLCSRVWMVLGQTIAEMHTKISSSEKI